MNIQEQVDAGVTGAFDKIKNLFVPKAAADLEKANLTIEELNKKISDLEKVIVAKDGEIKVAIEAKDLAEKKSKETEESVEARANQKALAIEQGRGVNTQLKDEEKKKDAPQGGEGKSKLAQYNELVAKGDTNAAAAFYNTNREDILNGK